MVEVESTITFVELQFCKVSTILVSFMVYPEVHLTHKLYIIGEAFCSMVIVLVGGSCVIVEALCVYRVSDADGHDPWYISQVIEAEHPEVGLSTIIGVVDTGDEEL